MWCKIKLIFAADKLHLSIVKDNFTRRSVCIFLYKISLIMCGLTSYRGIMIVLFF